MGRCVERVVLLMYAVKCGDVRVDVIRSMFLRERGDGGCSTCTMFQMTNKNTPMGMKKMALIPEPE